MTLPDSDLLYLREDELDAKGIAEIADGSWGNYPGDVTEAVYLLFSRLISARKEIHRLQIAAGEVIEERMGDDPV